MDPVEVVAEFYRVLVQKDPPTFEQEKALFGSCALRGHLLDKAGAPKTQPILMELYRKHHELFLPKNMKEEGDHIPIGISSPFGFQGSPGHIHKPHTTCVLVLFVDDKAARPARQRSVVFTIDPNGRLDGDAIYIGGFDGQMTYERFFDVEWVLKKIGTRPSE